MGGLIFFKHLQHYTDQNKQHSQCFCQEKSQNWIWSAFSLKYFARNWILYSKMSNEFGGRGRGTKRKVEQNSSTSSKKPRGELQTPALPGDAWVFNVLIIWYDFTVFFTFLQHSFNASCHMHAVLIGTFYELWYAFLQLLIW